MTALSDDEIARLRALPDELVGGRFRILGEAGSGGMGVVYRALDTEDDTVVALKVMTSSGKRGGERFALESDVLARLSHPAIVRYVAHGTTEDGEPWLAMEWLDGVSLAQRLAEGRLSWTDAVILARRVASALDVAHEHGIVHRDLKPANLFLAGGHVDDVRVLDFGVARVHGEGLTRTGEIIGTPGYMAPEQARGVKGIDPRADLFSLGCVLFRCITGEPAFEGGDVLEVLAKLVLYEPPRLRSSAPDAPHALEALVARMIAKERDERPASARTVIDALDRILAAPHEDTLVDSSPRVSSPTKAESPHARAASREHDDAPRISIPATTRAVRGPRRVTIAAIVAVLVGLGAAALWLAMHRAREPIAATPRAGTSAPPPRADDAARVCRAWIDAVVAAQRPDGSFGFERHREGQGWTTGQELFAVARSDGACGTPASHADVLRRGADALAAFRTDDGFRGQGLEGTRAETGATAWALLALTAVAERTNDDERRAQALDARALLLGHRTSDGGFRVHPDIADEPAHPYITVLALWALVESEPLDPSPTATDARSAAAAWVRDHLRARGEASMREVAGLAEQALWVLTRAEGGAVDHALAIELARSIVARCRLGAEGCARAIDDDGAIELDRGTPERGPNFIALWHPWVTLASHALASDASLDLPPALRDELARISRWGIGEMDRGVELLQAAPSYKLAEYLFVASQLAR